MDCKHPWSPEFMSANFPLSFRNGTLRKHRRKVLFERERAVLPAVQIYVEYQRQIDSLTKKIRTLNDELEALYVITRGQRDDDDSPEQAAIYLLHRKIRRCIEERARYDNLYAGVTQDTGKKREFIMKCPDDGCRGFLSSSYKCGTCDKWSCSQCLVVIGTERSATHECNKEAVESVKAIKDTTKPCPKCGTRIFKIDGCDQMWCVMEGCNTAFSWNTGQIETGRVHNPHYYEWRRQTGGGVAPREVGDIPCGGLPGHLIYGVEPRVKDYMRTLGNGQVNELLFIHGNFRQLIYDRLPGYPAQRAAMANKDLDVKYLMQTISEEEWQRQLEFAEARFKRAREIGQVLQMAATAGSDIFREIIGYVDTHPIKDFRTWIELTVMPMLETLRAFVNESLVNLAKREHMAVPQFGESWTWKPARALYRAKGGVAGAATDAAEAE
jgi:hypothetical protein